MDNKTKNQMQFIAGLIFALTGAAMMFFGVLPTPIRITFGIVGIALIAMSKVRPLR